MLFRTSLRGKRVAVVAGGPSVTPAVIHAVRSLDAMSIVINDAYRLIPEAAALFAADWEWWNAHPEALGFGGAKFVSRESNTLPGVEYVRPRPPVAGGNSALRAVHLAEDCGAATVFLFGVDLRDDDLTHWHGRHAEPLCNPTVETFVRAREAWAQYARVAHLEVINCNPRSALTCFAKVRVEELAVA